MTQATTWDVQQAADAPVTPSDFAARLKEMLEDAVLSAHSGSARPSYAVAFTVWGDVTDSGLYMYDGSSDLLVSVGGLRSQVHSELTIATGAITPTGPGTFPVDTEADAASDDLDTINATNVVDGDIIILKAANDARTVVVKNGTGNIDCGADFSLDNSLDRVMLQYDLGNTSWVMLSSNSNGA